jgi:thiamine biosynthesis lipoprotein
MTSVGKPGGRVIKSHSCEWLFCFFIVFFLAGCERELSPLQLAGSTMGTTWQVTLIESPPALTEQQLRQGIEVELDQVNNSMSTYLSDSEITRFNALEPQVWFEPSPAFTHVLTTALEIGYQSKGAYDVTVGPLVSLWGFGPEGMIDSPPQESVIAESLGRVGQGGLRLEPGKKRVMKDKVLSVDFSSLAKGYAVDQVAQWLHDQGANRFMVEVGGEMRLSGLSGRGDLWRIAIEQPVSSERTVAVTINLTDMSIATSGDYRNYFEVGGKRYSHSIDPRTGYPVTHDLVSVTVVHPSAMIADAWATAFTVMGAKQAKAVAKAHGLAVYFIRRTDDGLVHSNTPQFAGYLNPPQS